LDPFESLALSAEVAIAITGFSGVVLALGERRAGTASNGLLFRMLFTGTLIPIGVVAIAHILAAAMLEPPLIWQICSSIQVLSVVGISVMNRLISMRSELGRGGPAIIVGALVVASMQVINIFSLHAFWPVLAAVWWGIALSLVAFLRLLYASRAV
jgi:hypothetical protein